MDIKAPSPHDNATGQEEIDDLGNLNIEIIKRGNQQLSSYPKGERGGERDRSLSPYPRNMGDLDEQIVQYTGTLCGSSNQGLEAV